MIVFVFETEGADYSVDVYRSDVDESTTNAEDSKPSHVPLYLLPDSLRCFKPAVLSWDPYFAGDKSTQILRHFQPV